MTDQTTQNAGRSLTAIVLAAGKGTRMRSDLPKVLHRVAGRTMLGHVLAAAREAGAGRIAVVVEPGQEAVAREIATLAPGASVHPQAERLGTAHAVLAARTVLEEGVPEEGVLEEGASGAVGDDVVIAFGDTPLITAATLARLRAPLAEGAAVAVLAFETGNPTGYGRVLTQGDRVLAIREEKDASADERTVTLCNAGLMALSGAHALSLLTRIGNANAAGEYYLPDAVALAVADGLPVAVVPVAEAEAQGVNDRVQLAVAEAEIQGRLRRAAQVAGATLIAPETVFFSVDTVLGRDVLVEPHVVFGPGVTVGDACVVHSFSHLEGATLAPGVQVGPYARLRPGAVLETGARIGNFVEVKNARMGAGAKANHLTYVGDAEVGAGANLGAGTITCNYDGVNKHRTTIGAGAFIGSNTALVAPVQVGAGAIVGAGSVIASDVPDEALAVSRGRQRVVAGWAPGKRAALQAEKAARARKP